MINVVEIHKIEDLSSLLFEQKYDDKIHRNRSNFLYRGLPSESYHLVTSLERNCKSKQKELELSILRNFTKYASINDSALKESIWRQMIIGQHHGLPTRLLDWSYSLMIALNFSVSVDDLGSMENDNAIIWKIDINEFNELLPERYKNKLLEESAYLFTVEMLDGLNISLKDYDIDMGNKSMVLLEPPSIDQRIVNQYSYFSITPMGVNSIEEYLENMTNKTYKYIVDKSLKWKIRDMLDQMNINERMLFPGIDGLTKWMKRHYYVK